MPTYVYAVVLADGSLGETFETLQGLNDPPLTAHPQSGEPVVRLIAGCHVGGRHAEGAERQRLSDQNLGRLGFTKYQKVGEGQYERTVGKEGPAKIQRGDAG